MIQLTVNRRISMCVVLMCTLAASGLAYGAYPEKPIRFIVPAAAGGGADTGMRIIATALAQRLGQPILIDNKPGASGSIGLDALAKAAPDGYTIGTNNVTNFSMAPHVIKVLPYSTSRDFTPIAMLITSPYLLGVSASLPVKVGARVGRVCESAS
jgi:tripartite-type tricarboxylate transporter receptor subunit TctC